MYGSSLSALSDAWESVAAAKKELTNVDTKIRQTQANAASNVAASNPSKRSKENPNIERRVVMDFPVSLGMYRKENIPPTSHPLPKYYSNDDNDHDDNAKPVKQKENYAPDFNYNPNIPCDKFTLNTSSLSGRALFAKKASQSDALNRLKEKINQQKMNASCSNTSSAQDQHFLARKEHIESDKVIPKAEVVAVSIKEPMKRKVAQGPQAPTYKGFHHADKPPRKHATSTDFTQNKYNPKDSKLPKREPIKKGTKSKTLKEMSAEQNKMNRKVMKAKEKVHRIVSPKKPVQPITTTTWRIGQEIRENVIKERRNRTKCEKPVMEEKTAEATTTSNVVSSLAEKPFEDTQKSSKVTTQSTSKSKSEVSRDSTMANDESLPKDNAAPHDNSEEIDDLIEQDIDDNPEQDDNKDKDEDDNMESEVKISLSKSVPESKDLSKMLSKNALSIMSELTDVPLEKVKPKVDTGLKRKKVGKKSTPLKRKSDEANYPKQKVRHYDQDEVQKYMQKKQAERKQQRLKEKKMREEQAKTQQQKLQELYCKQKETLKENLEIGKRNVYGETFIKLSSKISSIMSDAACTSTHENTDASLSKDLSKDSSAIHIPQATMHTSPQLENSFGDMLKDSLEATQLLAGDKSISKPISPYKPGVQVTSDEKVEDTSSPSKANRVAAIHSTAAALRKRLDMEAKRISCLVKSRQANLNKSASEVPIPTLATVIDQGGFNGDVPGTQNLDEQAEFNMKMKRMENAAKRIQAFYRGHCTRKSLHWKLPSGRTLYQAFEGARRSAFLSDIKPVSPVHLASSGYPPITITNIKKKKMEEKEAEPQPLDPQSPVMMAESLAEPLQLDKSDMTVSSARQPVVRDDDDSDAENDDDDDDDEDDGENDVTQANEKSADVNTMSFEDEDEDENEDEGAGQQHGSTASLISEAFTMSRQLHETSKKASSRVSSSQHSKDLSNTIGKSVESFPSYSGEKDILANQEKLLQAVDEKAESLRKVLEKHKKVPGDKYSVINIFARNYPGLRNHHRDSLVLETSESDTEKVLADAYVEQMKLKDDSAYEYLTEQSCESLTEQSVDLSADETLTEQSIHSAADDIAPHKTDLVPGDPDDSRSISLSLAELPAKILKTSLSNKDVYTSHHSKPPSDKISERRASIELDTDASQASIVLSRPVSELDLRPVFSSTQRSMIDVKDLTTSEPTKTSQVKFADEVDYKDDNDQTVDGGDKFTDHLKEYQAGRMSPNTLERKLRAELNLFDNVGSSLQQVGDMVRVRNVTDAQQETVTLAQALKSRQVAHQQEMQRMSLAAKQQALEAAQEVEVVKRHAAETSVDVMKTIAEVKAKAAEEIAASAVTLAQLQQQQTVSTMEALNQVEQARQAAATAYKQSIDQQLPTVGELAATIALNVAQQQQQQQQKSRRGSYAPSSAAPSEFDYTNDFDGNKTTSRQSSTLLDKSGSSKQSTPSEDKTRSSKYGTPSSGGDKTSSSRRTTPGSNGDKSGSSKRSLYSVDDEAASNSKHSAATSVVDESIRSALDVSANDSKYSSQRSRNKTESSIPSESMANTVKTVSEKSVATSKSSSAPSTVVTAKDESDSHSDTVVEELTFQDLDTPKTTRTEQVKRRNDASGSIASVNEDSFSANSEDKINSSLTEEELKHDFRMVLPSENHRRKSLDCMDSFIMGNDTSSDELLVSPRVGKWMKKLRSKSPFADENTFTKFTANMVRQYIQEDEVRAKHQAALLELREKAIIEKTKAEMTYLEMQKKTKKTKGTDEKMPPITKKQRAVLLRLQAEQSEIRRLKEAHKAASLERRSMLYQQKQIEKIRESTKKIWNKLECMDKDGTPSKTLADETIKSEMSPKTLLNDTSPDNRSKSKSKLEVSNSSQEHLSSDIPDEATPAEDGGSRTESITESVVTEDRSAKDSPSAQTASIGTETSAKRTATAKSVPVSKSFLTSSKRDESISEVASLTRSKGEEISSALHESKDETSSIAQDLKQLKYASGKKYLTDREKKLETRKQQFTEIMSRESQLKDWRQKIIEEEQKLKEDIRKVLEKSKGKDLSLRLSSSRLGKHSPSSKQQTPTTNRTSDTSTRHSTVKEQLNFNDTLKNDGGDTSASIKEDYSSAKDLKTAEDDSIAEEVPSVAADSQSDAIRTEYSRRSGTTTAAITEEVSEKSRTAGASSYKYSTDHFESDFVSGKDDEDDDDDSRIDDVTRTPRGVSELMKRGDDDSVMTENTSDSSDIEQRLLGLEDELETRRLELERMRKKREKELLRLKEQELKKALQDVKQQIMRENKENIIPTQAPTTTPKPSSTNISSIPSKVNFSPEKDKIMTSSSRKSDLSARTSNNVPSSEVRTEVQSSQRFEKSIVEDIIEPEKTRSIDKSRSSVVAKISQSAKLSATEDIKTEIKSVQEPEYSDDDFEDESKFVTEQKSRNTSLHSIKTAPADAEFTEKDFEADETSQKSLSEQISISEKSKSISEQIKSVSEQIKSLTEKSDSFSKKSDSSISEKSKSLSEKSDSFWEKSKPISEKSKAISEKSKAVSERSKAISERSKAISESIMTTIDDEAVSGKSETSMSKIKSSKKDHDISRSNKESTREDIEDEEDAKSSKKTSVEEIVAATLKASLDLTDLYGDDFEDDAESAIGGETPRSNNVNPCSAQGTPRDATKRSIQTDDDLSEGVSEEIMSEYSEEKGSASKEVEKDTSRKISMSKSIKDQLSEKSTPASNKNSVHDEKSKHSSIKDKISELEKSISERMSTRKSERTKKSDGGKVSSKNENENYSYEDSFVEESSRMSTDAEESLNADSPRKDAVATSQSEVVSASSAKEKRKSVSSKEDAHSFKLDDQVKIEGIATGVIKFIGKTPFSKVIVAGVYLDEEVGTNDGTFQGVKYFDCVRNRGLFITLDRIKRITIEKEEKEENEEQASERADTEESSVLEEIEEADDIEEILSITAPDVSKSKDASQKSISRAWSAEPKSKASIIDDFLEKHDKSAKETLSNRSIGKKNVHQEDDNVQLKSSSTDSSEAEIPSPQKLDVGPMADNITDSILKSLLVEAIQMPFSSKPLKSDNEVVDDEKSVQSSIREELDEKSATRSASKSASKSPSKSPSKSKSASLRSPKKDLSSEQQKKKGKDETDTVNVATNKLIDEALSHMLRVQKEKQEKLSTRGDHVEDDDDDDENNQVGRLITEEELNENKFLALIAADNDMSDKLSDMADKTSDSSDNSSSLASDDVASLNIKNLQSVQDHLSALCGGDDDEDELDQISKASSGTVYLPPKIIREEPVLQIPWTVKDTTSLVFSALDELTNDSVTNENLASVEPSTDYFSTDLGNSSYNEPHAKLYKKLVFDSTKSILCEINEFHELQKQSKPPWMKAPRKTFSKFTHNSHMLDAETLCQTIANHISTCLDLQNGRPSLEKLKRRLPLNLNKKDYVDAVLVEEIREEEPQWVNYDEDELKVKVQLADDILNDLMQEIVEIINAKL